MFDDDDSLTCNNDTFMDLDDTETINLPIPYKQSSIQSWIAFSLLPRYTEKVEVPSSLSRLERALSSFTMYSQLKEANMDSHFEQVFVRLQMEWTYVGGLVCRFRFISMFLDHGPLFITARSFSCVSTYHPDHLALNVLIDLSFIRVDTAVFSIAPGSLFTVDTYARSAIAASSIASGLGIVCDAWFLLRYNWADLHTFIVSYLPTLALLVYLIFKLHIYRLALEMSMDLIFSSPSLPEFLAFACSSPLPVSWGSSVLSLLTLGLTVSLLSPSLLVS